MGKIIDWCSSTPAETGVAHAMRIDCKAVRAQDREGSPEAPATTLVRFRPWHMACGLGRWSLAADGLAGTALGLGSVLGRLRRSYGRVAPVVSGHSRREVPSSWAAAFETGHMRSGRGQVESRVRRASRRR